jgi:hypothetical protein
LIHFERVGAYPEGQSSEEAKVLLAHLECLKEMSNSLLSDMIADEEGGETKKVKGTDEKMVDESEKEEGDGEDEFDGE